MKHMIVVIAAAAGIAGPPPPAASPAPTVKPEMTLADATTVRDIYGKLTQHLAGESPGCLMAPGIVGEEGVRAVVELANAVKAADLKAAEPVRIALPAAYFHPQGKTLVVESSQPVLYRAADARIFVMVTKTVSGLRLQSNGIVLKKDGGMLCVEGPGTVLPYAGPSPGNATSPPGR